MQTAGEEARPWQQRLPAAGPQPSVCHERGRTIVLSRQVTLTVGLDCSPTGRLHEAPRVMAEHGGKRGRANMAKPLQGKEERSPEGRDGYVTNTCQAYLEGEHVMAKRAPKIHIAHPLTRVRRRRRRRLRSRRHRSVTAFFSLSFFLSFFLSRQMN